MKKSVLIALILLLQLQTKALNVRDYFESFYSNCLETRKEEIQDVKTLDFIKQNSDNKIIELEKNLLLAKNNDEIEEALFLIDEEYYDFLDNINFELGCINCCPLTGRENKKLKKAHKKFMRRLEKSCLNSLR